MGKKYMKKQQVISMYNKRLENYGTIPESVGWKDLETQYLRFHELIVNLDLDETKTILDLGCGYGSLLDFFKKNKIKILEKNYFGVDFSEKMIQEAQSKFPKAEFICSDFFEISLKKFDYVICSGGLNIKINKQDPYQNLEKFIATFFPISKVALSFNLIHDLVDYKEKNLNYYHLPKVVELISLFSRTFSLKNGSQLFETSVTIY